MAQRSRLPIPVAAAVRAAIDWLTQPGAAAVVRLYGEPSLLELKLERIRTDRLYPVHRVIAAAGGNLGPASEGPGWVVRVPSFAERPTYLMLVQGGVRIAVPWHAVLKLRIVSTQAGPGGRGSMEYAVVPPIAPPAPDAREHPVVLIGHGLKRAYLIADRLIWRMTAEPCDDAQGSPGGVLSDAVRTEDGEVFWVADPARLLAEVELPHLTFDPATVAPDLRVLEAADVRPLGIDLTAAEAPESADIATAAPALEAVEPGSQLGGPTVRSFVAAVPAAPAAEPAPVPPIAMAAPAAPPTARAIVADDSLTMRLLLARLLEQHGFTVETVSSTAELMSQLEGATWTVLFTDLELPDGSGPEWLRQVCRAAASRPHPVHVVALVRDGGDLDVARSVGVQDTLLKPFARESLAALLVRHGWSKA